MTSKPIRRLKPIIYLILFFFCWTNLGIYNIAYAAASGSNQPSAISGQQKAKTAEEKFQESLERLSDAVGKEDSAKIKAEKTELEKLDVEIKKQFKETEEKIKGLSEAVKQRHRDFVKKYEENLNTLKGHLDGIEKAKTNTEKQQANAKIKDFLEKTKPPKRHVPLDPNKLPHRTPEIKKREPRLKKEEFEPQSTQRAQRKAPIMVAANGPLTGLVSELPTYSPSPLAGEGWGEGEMVLALNTSDLPTASDLSQTIEVQFTPDIQAKAQELNYNPVKIYEWVRNNIEYVPTYGSIQGADMCLQTKQCNDFDTASLLIALLRASNISARYVYGTIEVPIDKVMNWVGGFTNVQAAVNFIASGGVPIKAYASGGKIAKVQMEHVWVKAFIDYIPSRGAVHKEADTWIPLDGSFKQYTYTSGIDLQSAVPFDGQSFTDQIKAASTINAQDGYVTNVNSTLVQNALSDYNARLTNYVNTNFPNATVGDILGKKEIVKKDQQILPASLPYKTIVTGGIYTEIPQNYRHTVTIQLTDTDYFGDTNAAFSYTTILPQIAGKKITVSYEPATQADQDTINSYAEQYASSIPAYLINMKPVLKIEGATVASGPSVGMGTAQNLNVSISSTKSTEIVTHSLNAGSYTAIGINPSRIALETLQKRVDKNDFSEPVGEMLHQTALSYWAEADAFNDVTAKTLQVNTIRHPSELAATAKISVTYLYGVPSTATYKSRNLDVKLDNQSVLSKTGDKAKEFSYMQQSGTTSSFLEGAVFDQLFGRNIGDGNNAITVIKEANDRGIPIYKLNATNISLALPKLQIDEAVKTEISNAINAGLTVQIPQMNVTRNGWTGVGYIIMNPTDGSGAYRISGGLNGNDSAAEGQTASPLPAVPLTGAASYVIGAFTSNSGAVLKVNAVTGVMEGIEIAAAAEAATALLSAMMLAILIMSILITIYNNLPTNYKPYRHYTSFIWKTIILSSKCINASGWLGDLWLPGVYVTDLTIEPDSKDKREDIQKKLNLDSYDKTETYVSMEIDRNRVILLSLPWVPYQYLHPLPSLCHNPPNVIFDLFQ